MKKNVENLTYVTNKIVESIVITDDIAVIHIQDICENRVIYETYCYCHPTNITTSTKEFNFEKDNNYNNLMFFKKSFLEFYKTYDRPYDLESFVKSFGVDPRTLWEGLVDNTINIDDYIPVEVSFYDNHIYPFTYGKEREGWFPHMVRYSATCYHITNKEYELDKVAKFLEEQEKEGNVIIQQGPYYSVGEDEIIRGIPSYNQFSGSTEYINFYTYIDTREEYDNVKKDLLGLWTNPKWEKLLEPFKIKQNLYSED